MSETSVSKIEVGDGERTNPRFARWRHVIPLPPDGLLWSVGGATLDIFLVVGDAWAQLVSTYTTPDCAVLDIGCGCGRIARVLVNNRHITRYIGFDVIPENIKWCQQFIQEPHPGRFEFYHYDLYSKEYNASARLRVQDLRFPCPDSSIQVTFAASVFTHLLENDARHYLREIRRTLVPGGKALLSIHTDPAPGKHFSGTETRIDIRPEYFAKMCADAGLGVFEQLGEVGGQEVFVVTLAH